MRPSSIKQNTAAEAKRLEQRMEDTRLDHKSTKSQNILEQVIAQKAGQIIKKQMQTALQQDTQDLPQKKDFQEKRLLDQKFLHAPLAHAQQQAMLQKRDFDFNQQLNVSQSPDQDIESLHAHDPLQNAHASGNQVQSHELTDYAKQPRTVEQQQKDAKNSQTAKVAIENKAKKDDAKKTALGWFWRFLAWIWQALLRLLGLVYRLFFPAPVVVKKPYKRYRAKFKVGFKH